MNKTFLFYIGLSLLNVMVLKGLSVKLHTFIINEKAHKKDKSYNCRYYKFKQFI
jgi:hypothetical protein